MKACLPDDLYCAAMESALAWHRGAAEAAQRPASVTKVVRTWLSAFAQASEAEREACLGSCATGSLTKASESYVVRVSVDDNVAECILAETRRRRSLHLEGRSCTQRAVVNDVAAACLAGILPLAQTGTEKPL